MLRWKFIIIAETFGPGEAAVLAGLAAAADTGTRLAHPFVAAIPLREATPAEQSVETMFVAPVDDGQVPLFIYGAGHVARAVVPRMMGLGFDLFLVDVAKSRFRHLTVTPPHMFWRATLKRSLCGRQLMQSSCYDA